tara:strand:- start:1273 stop:1650 length:378 start_codon:yes stop_codon:yes gene_type:complete
MEYASLGLAGLIGYMVGWALANIMQLGRTALFVERTGLQTLKLMVTIAEDVEFVRTLKYRIAEEEFGDNAAALRQKNVDDYELARWKKAVIDSYLSSYPATFKRQVPFNDWDGAVRHFEQNRRKL